MKFTYPQKKWVLTTALLAVLGFNVSFNSHNDGIASADFASTDGDLMESKVYTSEGAIPVKYINNGEKKVLAVVPKKMTEGKVCDDCGFDTIPLNVKNKTDIDAINVELMKVLEKSKKAKAEVAEEEAADEAEEEVVVKKKKDYFARIESICKGAYSSDETLKCYKDEYLRILNDKKKSKVITSSEALDFYKEQIQPRLVKQLTEARRISSNARRAKVDGRFWQSFRDSDEFEMNPNEIIQNSLYIIEDLIREVPSKYESVRQRVIIAETDVLKFEAAQVKATNAQAEANKGTAEGLFLTQEAGYKLAETHTLREALSALTSSALIEARSNNTINDDQKSAYDKFILEFNKNLVAALSGQGTLLDGIQVNPAIDLSGRLQNPGRGTSTIGTLPGTQIPAGSAPVSSRTGATLSAPAQGTIGTLPNSGNGGVSFGTPREASAEALQMRAQIRGRQ